MAHGITARAETTLIAMGKCDPCRFVVAINASWSRHRKNLTNRSSSAFAGAVQWVRATGCSAIREVN